MTSAMESESKLRLNRFIRSRDEVLILLSDLMTIAAELEAQKLCDQLLEAKRQLNEEVFRVVVMGEFSNGKSTLINALMGERILPSSTFPTTTVLTVITFGEKQRCELVFFDGSKQEISPDSFRNLVAPQEPDEQDSVDVERYRKEREEATKINFARVEFPASLCKEGVAIVDTPGTNDLDSIRERITHEFVPNADAAIMVLSARQPLSSKEFEFLTGRVLPSDVGRLFFVVNFKDFLKSEIDLKKQSNFFHEHLSKVVENPRIFFVCSSDALSHRVRTKDKMPELSLEATGIPALEQELSDFLQSSRASVKLDRHINAGCRVANNLLTGPLAIRRSALGASLGDVRKLISSERPKLAKAQLEYENVIRKLQTSLLSDTELNLSALRTDLLKIVSEGVNAVKAFKGEPNGKNVSRVVESAIAAKHSAAVESAKHRQEELMKKRCAESESQLRSILQSTQISFCIKLDDLAVKETLTQIDTKNEYRANTVDMSDPFVATSVVTKVLWQAAKGILTNNPNIWEAEEKKDRDADIKLAASQVQQKLSEGVPKTVLAFEREAKLAIKGVCQSFADAFVTRVETMQSELNQLELRKQSEQLKVRDEAAYYQELQSRIQTTAIALENCRWKI
jgi:GTPase SAR1 family protein